MDNRIDRKYISNAIDELIRSVGVKEDADCGRLETLLHAKETKKCIKVIASQLGLPIEINVSFVPKDYRPGESYYKSQDLSRTDSRGRGIEAITAQVSIPHNLPLYGTKALTNFSINVKVSENCNEQPMTFVSIMAHELSHVLLHSLMHPQKDNEFYTDLIAMILGFSSFTEKGRKSIKTTDTLLTTETQTTTYGYLNDRQFFFARSKINSILKKYKSIKKQLWDEITEFKKICSESKKTLLRFSKFLGYLDNHRDKKIRKADTSKIVLFHQTGYTQEIEKATRESEKLLTDVTNFCKNLVHYTDHTQDLVQQYLKQVKALRESLEGKRRVLDDDVKMLRRYVSLWFRMRTAIKIRKV